MINIKDKMIFLIVFVAIAVVCSGETTTPFVPRTDCGIGALKCYNDQEAGLNNKLESLDFAGACQIYKVAISCIANVGDCSGDLDSQVILQRLDAIQDGICGVDGSIQSCGKDVHVCFTEMNEVMADALIKNFTNACVLSGKFISCASNVTISKECPNSLVSRLEEIEQDLNEDGQTFGCDGPCVQAVAFCALNASTVPTNQSILSADLDSFCRSSSKVFACLNGLQTNVACTGPSLPYLKAIAQNDLTKVGDICTEDGNISACVQNLRECAADLKAVKSGSNVTVQCTASSEFLECVSRLPCTSALAPLVANFQTSIQTEEAKLQCPSIGSCNQRFTVCGNQDHGFVNITSLNREGVCRTAAVALWCYSNVKNDPICINEYYSFADQEQRILGLINNECGGASTGLSTGSSSTTAFVPTSVCGVGAQRCYSSQRDVMDSKFESMDYASACQYYKSIVACMDNVGECATDRDFVVVQQQLLDDVDGICGIDGSIQGCGRDVHVCFTAMEAGVNDMLTKNFSAACLLIGQFVSCANNVAAVKECPDSLVNKLNEMMQSLSTDEKAIKCDGPCPLAIQSCIANVTTISFYQNIFTVDFSVFCRIATDVYNCLNSLETSAACITPSSSYLQSFVQNQLTKVHELCNTNGTATSCVSEVTECAADLNAINNHSDTATQCQSLSEYLECTSDLPCSLTLAPLIASLRSRFETDEAEMQCPSIGSCNDRWTRCGHQEQGLANVSSTDKDTICKTAKTGIKCFDFVKSDPLCINEKNSFITQEQSLNMVLKAKCGAAVSWFIKLHLFVAALLVSLMLNL